MDQIEKLGQLFLFGFAGLEPDERILRMIRDFGLGGVILFSRNIGDPLQTAKLVEQLQGEAEIPLFIGIDQEGGRVCRLTDHFTRFAGSRALGKAGSFDLARAFGQATGEELSAVGVNLDFAPVLDVDSNPRNPIIGSRSFGEDPELVGRLGCAVIQGLEEKGIIACGKHFPGHGDTVLDSHLALPEVSAGLKTLRERELIPFVRALDCGLGTLMTAHVRYPALDPELPATLSPKIIDKILRKELGFQGVVFSDDLEMKAVDEQFGIEASAVQAINAGVDVVLICKEEGKQEKGMAAVGKAAETGEISQSRIDEAVNRVLALKKQRLASPFRAEPPLIAKKLRSKEHLELADTIQDYWTV